MILVQEATTPVALAKVRERVDELPLLENLLVHADLEPPLAERTRVFLGFSADGDLRGVGTAYLGFGHPALGVAVLPSWDAGVASDILKAMKDGVDLPAIAIDELSREPAYQATFKVKTRHEETHYVLRPEAALPIREKTAVERVPREELPRLDAFLREHGATAWSKESFETGPYFWIREDDAIVAAAGVHFETPVIAQIANVLVREDRRGRGYGLAVVAKLARRLRDSGKVVSLFVKSDNGRAIGLYEGLGFRAVRRLAYLELE